MDKKQAKKSFWKRHGLTGSKSSNTHDNTVTTTTAAAPVVIGASYTYLTTTTKDNSIISDFMLPSQYPNNSNKNNKNNKKKYKQQQQQEHQHIHSARHVKSFDAFMDETNDEWSNDIFQQQQPKQAQPIKIQQQQQEPVKRKPKYKRIKPNVKDIISDPTCALIHFTKTDDRSQKFIHLLSHPTVDLTLLSQLCWNGIPFQLRMMAWQMLFGYLPCHSARREVALAQKRKEYMDSVKATQTMDRGLWRQIHIDILRTNPTIPLYQCEAVQKCLERILYQWAIRHPASGYVQGINDLVTPIFEVFLSGYIENEDDPEEFDADQLDPGILSVIEADSFWCLSKLLAGIQDNYIFAQPGILRQIATLNELVSRIDAPLFQHLQNEGVEFIQFSFRWMNCLLMRELTLALTIRMWDTYLAEGSSEGFSEFHVYVCAAFLVKWSSQLQKLDFQGMMIFLQELPTQAWKEKDIELLLSEAYMWKSLFHNAPSHLKK